MSGAGERERPSEGERTAGGGREWPSVSVLLPTHDRPQLLAGAVRAILAQEYPGPIECLVVFDRKDPEPIPVEVPEGRELRLLRNARTPGPAGCYNTAALEASGDLVALCDDDDEWLPDKLRLQVEALEEAPGAVLAIAGIYTVGRSTVARVHESTRLDIDELLEAPRNTTHSSTFLVRRDDMLHRVGLFDEETPGGYGEDVEWMARCARLGPVVSVPRPLVRVRFAYSYFGDRWNVIVAAIQYWLEAIPEFSRQARPLSKLHARMAFGHAAVGRPREARAHAWKAIRLRPRQPLAYLAVLVSLRILPARFVQRVAHLAGRGI